MLGTNIKLLILIEAKIASVFIKLPKEFMIRWIRDSHTITVVDSENSSTLKG